MYDIEVRIAEIIKIVSQLKREESTEKWKLDQRTFWNNMWGQ